MRAQKLEETGKQEKSEFVFGRKQFEATSGNMAVATRQTEFCSNVSE